MIAFRKFILDNGLTLLVTEDNSTPLVSVNILYDVGSRDEDPRRTGFAHLFEHLMFGGTELVPDYDSIVSRSGGESNAFTNNDFTNYYVTLPAQYLETALWLESDRMRKLDFSQRSLSVQQSVVTEEYNYRYINQPYGDKWLLLRPLCYKVHPYRWCTIGSDIRHVQEATLADVEAFFYRYYRPNNAIMAVAGPVDAERVAAMVEKWFGDIPAGDPVVRCLPAEPEQTEARLLEVERDVPSDNLMMAYPTAGRANNDLRVADLVTDVLTNGQSSRMYNELVKHRGMFTEIDTCITGDTDPGLLLVDGKLRDGVGFDEARAAVEEQLRDIASGTVGEQELQKVVNKYETTFSFSQYKAMGCAMSLCYYERLGHVEWVNDEPDLYRKVTVDDVQRVASAMFQPQKQSTIYYKSKK